MVGEGRVRTGDGSNIHRAPTQTARAEHSVVSCLAYWKHPQYMWPQYIAATNKDKTALAESAAVLKRVGGRVG